MANPGHLELLQKGVEPLIVPRYMIPFVPIIQEGAQPFAMFRDLWQKHRDWVLDPLVYGSVEELVQVFESAVIEPANQRLAQLEAKKAEELVTRHVGDFPRDAQ